MPAATTKAKLVPVVSTHDDMYQTTRRAGIWIVANGKDTADGINANAKRIPKASRDAFQPVSIRPAAIDVASFTSAVERPIVTATDHVWLAQILTKAEIQIASAIKG